ncbi:MAG: tRNA preQ1(34) S-adenosylmethionine ribosyltransferase-isomerase QueA [Elusimicrobia bacterium]|nr:tRNA preQ1(34) S-adenosylmethionine ribosyltransferase-isomerase QueA [Elusimicrobiota bacterium]
MPMSEFDFDFPEELVASAPAEPRDSSRLLFLDRSNGRREHASFRDLPRYLRAGDCLVLNRSRVLLCRLRGKKSSGGKADLLLVDTPEPGLWTALSSGLKAGQRLEFPGGLGACVEGLNSEGEYLCRFDLPDLASYLEQHGLPPLPPYILKRKQASASDKERYQTLYAREPGSIAAPTAGLHFTPELLEFLAREGVTIATLTLHVGRGTFRPITADDAAEHNMLPEWYRLEPAQAELINQARLAGGRIVAVGTTVTRTLETLARQPGGFGPGEGRSDLYIFPGFDFRVVTGLITNFHLPRSTPLMLACAFAGRDKLLEAYQEAFQKRYRLYSYGDAMLIL